MATPKLTDDHEKLPTRDTQQLMIRNLSCWRNPKSNHNTPATLKDISLHVNQGELLVVMGSSGSGKTSLLRVIAGLEKNCQGEMYLQDKLIQTNQKILVPTEKRGIGFIFQDYALFPHLTVYQNIQFGL